MSNQEITKILEEMAALLEMQGVAFKPRAYEKAATGVEALGEEVQEIYRRGGGKALEEIPGVGRGIAAHIEELLEKGKLQEYERLRKRVPVHVTELMSVEGVGPMMVKVLWEKLRVRTLADLERAARAGKIRRLPRFGEKSEQKILRGIAFLRGTAGRRTLGVALSDARRLEAVIRAFPEVEDAAVAGSLRRWKETIGDIDVLAASADPQKVTERFLALPDVARVYGTGETQTRVRLKNGMDADLRVVAPQSWGAALNYFTGSKEHNVALREIAVKKGWKLNEYGLFARSRTSPGLSPRRSGLQPREGGKSDFGACIAGRTEGEIYKKLGLRYIEPELREDTGEIEAARHDFAAQNRGGQARKNKLPALIGYRDLKGDLQVQTDWTDGEDSIEKMAQAARDAGLEYIAITDHTKGLAMTGGADEKKLMRQMREIDLLNKKFKSLKFKILKGAEVNIGKNGSLDIDDAMLARLDVVGAAVHSHFTLSRQEQTARIIRAMENPHVDIIFHLTGRIIAKRASIDLDIDAVIAAAKRTGTVLEVNAYPDRLDIRDAYIRKAVAADVRLSIDSDAHAAAHFKLLEYGIATARRGWAEKKDVVNAWSVEKMLKMLK